MARRNRSDRFRKLNNKGLTLVEVMISVTIFAIVAAPIVKQMNTLLKTNYSAKVSQAETDYATRVMEQFKEDNSDAVTLPVDSDGDPTGNITLAGYTKTVDPGNESIATYTMDGVRLEKDIDSSETSVTRQGTTYKVEVTLDPTEYDTSSGNTIAGKEYKNPNDTSYYAMENLDDEFAILVKENSANYDDRASDDLVDLLAADLKKRDAERYNLWLGGSDIFSAVTYTKNTTVKVSYDSAKDAYLATVIISYTDTTYHQTVSYTIMKDKKYSAKKLGNKPPSIYIFYNQFVQNNDIKDNNETITIDNSGLVGANGKVANKNALKCYLVKNTGSEDGHTYTYYQRKDAPSVGDELYGGVYRTQNTALSEVYYVENDGTKYYRWPSYILTQDEFDAKTPASAITTNEDGQQVVDVSKNGYVQEFGTAVEPRTMAVTKDDGTVEQLTFYEFLNVLVPESFPHATPSATQYNKLEGKGSYSYICKNDTEIEGTHDSTGRKSSEVIKEGQAVYLSGEEYVWPDGSKSVKPPTLKKNVTIGGVSVPITYFTLCKPYKLDYNTSAHVNLMLTSTSALKTKGNRNAVTVYTNVDKNLFNTTTTGGVSLAEKSSVNGKDVYTYIKDLADDKSEGEYRLYRIKLNLYRVSNGIEKKIMSLVSGKED